MAPSDSEDDNLEDLEYDGDDDPDADVDDEPLDGGADDVTEEADDVCFCLPGPQTSAYYCITLSVARSQDRRMRTTDSTRTRTKNRSLLERRQWT